MTLCFNMLYTEFHVKWRSSYGLSNDTDLAKQIFHTIILNLSQIMDTVKQDLLLCETCNATQNVGSIYIFAKKFPISNLHASLAEVTSTILKLTGVLK